MSESSAHSAAESPVLADDELLVAYLDGELTAERRQEVEQRLSDDTDFRHRLTLLERAWDLLDTLPRPEAGDEFAQTTVEMVAVQAETDLEENRRSVTRFLPWIGVFSGLLLTTAIGYGVTIQLLSAANRQIEADLPVIANLEVLQVAESIEFLELLVENGVFSADEKLEETIIDLPKPFEATDSENKASDSLQDLKAEASSGLSDTRLWELSAADLGELTDLERLELVEQKERFANLSPVEQETLRELYQELRNHPDSAALFTAAVEYQEFLRLLESYQQAELRSLAAADKLPRIRQLQTRFEEDRFRRLVQNLSQEDSEAVLNWMDKLVKDRTPKLLESMPESRRKRLNALDEQRRKTAMLMMISQAPGNLGPTSAELAALKESLSPDSRKVMQLAEKNKRLREVVSEWIKAATFSRTLRQIPQEKLREFFARRLSPEEREKIEALGPAEFYAELRRRYLDNQFRRERGRPEGPPRGGGWGGEGGRRPPRGDEGRPFPRFEDGKPPKPPGIGPNGRGDDNGPYRGPRRLGTEPADSQAFDLPVE